MTIASEYIDELFARTAAYGRSVRETENFPRWILLYPKHLTGKLRDMALKDQKGFCFYCGKHVPKKKATADHIVPKSKGGETSRANIVAACSTCNQRKGSMHYLDFLEVLSRNNYNLPE